MFKLLCLNSFCIFITWACPLSLPPSLLPSFLPFFPLSFLSSLFPSFSKYFLNYYVPMYLIDNIYLKLIELKTTYSDSQNVYVK